MSERANANAGLSTTLRRVRRALVLVAVGLGIQLATTLMWTPLTFVLFAALGLGAVGLGAAAFLWSIWRHIDEADEEASS